MAAHRAAEDLQDYHAALIHARNELIGKAPIGASDWPAELGERPQDGSAAQVDAHAVAKERADRDQDMHIEGLDVSMQVRLGGLGRADDTGLSGDGAAPSSTARRTCSARYGVIRGLQWAQAALLKPI